MLSDIEIAQKAKLKNIEKIARKAGIKKSELESYGHYKAKVNLCIFNRLKKKKKDGKLILVTTMTPTPQGEGKTTITIGLAQALKRAFICIREPSLGPVMGLKGGAAGGGYSQVLPMDEINLHFTGDLHNVTAAHNLLAAMLYNHIFRGNKLNIDPKRIVWKRVMDMNDRSLRGQFDITASSEVMAVVCLSKSITDMKQRLARIIVAYDKKGRPITARDLKAPGAMALLMKDGLKPNLVQSIEGTPAFIHGGPFANIAHGCNALMATKMALKLADYVVTEAGFGSDLGAEKFFDIKCRKGGLKPNAVVLVVTCRAFKKHGIENLAKHVEGLSLFGVPVVVAINHRLEDNKTDIKQVFKACKQLEVPYALTDVWAKGGAGGKNLAKKVIKACRQKSNFKYIYAVSDPLEVKLDKIAKKIYGADGVIFSRQAKKDILNLKKTKLDKLLVCVAKTQYSLSDDPKVFGRPKYYKIKVRSLKPSAGPGFIVAYTGDIMTMPGLPDHPAAEKMDISESGKITGLF